jgi:hypothetical protein
MLPDYPKTKDMLQKWLMERAKRIMRDTEPFMNQVPRKLIQEGREMCIVHEDGTVHITNMKEISSEIRIPNAELKSMKPEELLRRFDAMFTEMAKKQAGVVLDGIGKAAESVGNVAKNTRNLREGFLAMVEKVEMDFDENDNPIHPSIVAGKEVVEELMKLAPEVENDPEFTKKHDEIIERKRLEFHEREAARKLVE